MNITLRKKKNKTGKSSLYLDITDKGRHRMFLKMFLYDKPKNQLEKIHNEETLRQANEISLRRQLAHQAEGHGIKANASSKTDFIEYFTAWGVTEKNRFADFKKVDACMVHLKAFIQNRGRSTIRLSELNRLFCMDFVDHLKDNCQPATAKAYFNKFRKCLKRASDEKLLSFHPSDLKVKFRIDKDAIKKPLLSEAEIKLLKQTPCSNETIRAAYLFCYHMGFDYATISKSFKWKCIDGKWINFERSKTERTKSYFMNEHAFGLLPKKGKPDELVFKVPTWERCVHVVRKWAKDAGIEKKLTWHSVRHSLATNLLNDYGQDIGVIQHILGHEDIATTQRYAKIRKETVKKAMERMDEG